MSFLCGTEPKSSQNIGCHNDEKKNTRAALVNLVIQIAVSGTVCYVFTVLVIFCTELTLCGIKPKFSDNVRCLTKY